MGRDMSFDRSISDGLLDMLSDGPASQLVDMARDQPSTPALYDLQLRREPKVSNPRSWATLYYGMTALINLEERGASYRLTAHPGYQELVAFDDGWVEWQDREEVESAWPRVATYLDEIADQVDRRHISKEGAVHAAISSGESDAYRVINRETRPSFVDTSTRTRRSEGWVAPFNEALARVADAPGWWPGPVKVGTSPDFLAVDIGGRLAVVEAKADSATASELVKVAVQVGVYAAMFAALLREDPDAIAAIAEMLAQRARLGLSRRGVLHLRDERRVVPVIAVGPGRPSDEVRRRMWEVTTAVEDAHGPAVDPVEVWYLDDTGRISAVERAADVRADQ
jgi:hypothetical protein